MVYRGNIVRSFYVISDLWKHTRTKRDYDGSNSDGKKSMGEGGVDGLPF